MKIPLDLSHRKERKKVKGKIDEVISASNKRRDEAYTIIK